MLTVHNFLAPVVSPNPADVITEHHAYGPIDTTGFAANLALDIDESFQPNGLVIAMVSGFVRIEEADIFNPESAVQLLLTPTPADALELAKAANDSGMMNPTGFRYSGIELATLEEQFGDEVRAMDVDPALAITPADKWVAFLDGDVALKVDGGRQFGLVAQDVDSGQRRLRFEVVVRNGHLDPVAVFKSLLEPNSYIDIVGTQNSWLDVARQDRILVSLRDEWDEPLTNFYHATVTIDQSSTQFFLQPTNNGTFSLDSEPGDFVLEVNERSLTELKHHNDDGASETLSFNLTPPMHVVIGSVKGEDWFATQNPPLTGAQALFQYTEGNRVEYLIDGTDTYRAMVSDLKLISNSNHFVLFSNWWHDPDFALLPGDPSTTIRQIANDISGTGARIRAMLWDHWLYTITLAPVNTTAFNLYRNLANASAIIDSRTHHVFPTSGAVSLSEDFDAYDPFAIFSFFEGTFFHAGSHHWKATVIRNVQSTIAYLGGIDINPNRLDDQSHSANKPYHDVHCRIHGPAVHDVTKAFVDRWNDHPDRNSDLESPGQLLGGTPAEAGTCMVQIARTYGATTQSYAPLGDRTIWATIEKAINRAKKYVYIEDQYLSSIALSTALLGALERIDHLIIVVDGTGGSRWDSLRHMFIQPLYVKAEQKVHLFKLSINDEDFKVHTKSVIIDDVIATIGSANMCRRSLTHDSEINAFVIDGAISNGSRKFARDYRIALWGEHMGWQNQPDVAEAELGDIDNAIDIFLNKRPAASRIAPHDVTPSLLDLPITGWEHIEDPDGSLPPT